MIKNILYIILLLLPFAGKGQTEISTNQVEILSLNKGKLTPEIADTSLSEFHYFYPNYKTFKVVNSNLGAPVIHLNVVDNYNWQPILQNNYSFYAAKQQGYIKTNKPYTNLFYSNGTQKEQYFNIIHSQRIKKGWNITAQLNKINSTGFYNNQQTNNTIASISSIYVSKKQKNILLSNYQFTKINNQENGGLVTNLDFENNFTDKQFIAVNQTKASNTIRNHTLNLTNYFSPFKKDSLISKNSYLVSEFTFSDNKYIYTDANADSLYYLPLHTNNQSVVYDSINYKKVKGVFGWQNYSPLKSQKNIFVSLKGGTELYAISQNFVDKKLSNYFGNAFLQLNPRNKIIAQVSLQYFFEGYRKNNIGADLTIGYQFDSIQNTRLWMSAHYDKTTPNYNFSQFTSQIISWNNEIKAIQTASTSLNFKSTKTRSLVSLKYNSLTNPVYLNSLLKATQFNGSSHLFSVSIQQEIKVKKVHLLTKLLYQKVLDSDFFRVPQFVTFNSIYFESFLFNKATLMRIGADFYYNTAYYANGYSSMYRSFYLQNEKQIGNYPFVDFYVTAKIKQARVFVKITHLNSGFFGNTYYASPSYPMADRMIRLGVNWSFWN